LKEQSFLVRKGWLLPASFGPPGRDGERGCQSGFSRTARIDNVVIHGQGDGNLIIQVALTLVSFTRISGT